MKTRLPEDDRVWSAWWNLIQSFKSIMKWISKLVSGTLKEEHFEEIFSSIGVSYHKEKAYTTQELIDLKLDDFADLITSIYKKANYELFTMQLFNQIKDLWTNKVKFKMAKYFPGKKEENPNESYQKITNFNFVLIDINEIRYLVEVN